MLEMHEHDAQDVIELIVDGAVTREEYEAVRNRAEAFINRRGRARLLEVILDPGPVDPAVFWEDTRFAFRHMGDFSRIAVVTERKWLAELLAGLQKIFVGEAKGFTLDECEEAWNWLTEHALDKGRGPNCARLADRGDDIS